MKSVDVADYFYDFPYAMVCRCRICSAEVSNEYRYMNYHLETDHGFYDAGINGLYQKVRVIR